MQPQLVGQPPIPAEPVIPTGKIVASAQPGSISASSAEKKALGQSRQPSDDHAENAGDLIKTEQPTPTIPTALTSTAPTPAAGLDGAMLQLGQLKPDGDDTASLPQPGADATLQPPKPGVTVTTADTRRAKGKSDNTAPAESTPPTAEAKALPEPAAHVAPAITAAPAPPPAPQTAAQTDTRPPAARDGTAATSAVSGSAELRRTKFAAADPEETSPATPTEFTSLLAATTAAPSATPAAPPHPAISAALQPATWSAPQASSSAPPPPPAIQVAQAVAEPVRVALATPPQQSGGPHVTTIQLDPVELGRVEIRIERTNDGPAKIELAAQRPDTLLRLVHDQAQLHQALDQAGIPQQGRTVTFSLATDSGSAGSSFANLTGGGFNGNGQRSHQGYGNTPAGAADTVDAIGPAPVWTRTGLDITA